MAFEAPMKAWFADPHASRPEENAEEDGGGARTVPGIGSPLDVRRRKVE